LNAQTNLWMTDPIALKEYKLAQQLSHLVGFLANKVYYPMMMNAAPARRGAGRIWSFMRSFSNSKGSVDEHYDYNNNYLINLSCLTQRKN
jgi:hypothetical protein